MPDTGRRALAGSEHGSITQQIRIAASPGVVYEVISTPEHIARWWTDAADFEPTPGSTGVLTWTADATTERDHDYVVQLAVVDAVPGQRFSFRWVSPEGEAPTESNSMLVTFALAPDGDGTLLTVTEQGMRERDWEAAVLEEYYASHEDGWARHLADLATYVSQLGAR